MWDVGCGICRSGDGCLVLGGEDGVVVVVSKGYV